MILLLGPCKTKKDHTITGGTIVLFEDLIDWCEINNVPHKIVDTNKNNYCNKLWAYINIIFSSLIGVFSCNKVTIHGSNKDYLFIAPFIILYSKIARKKIILRKFAGNFDIYYQGKGFLPKMVLRYVLKKSNIIYFETKKLVAFGSQFNKNCFWFPNVRKALDSKNKMNNYTKKFVFISQVKNSKGIVEICQSVKTLSNDYIIHIFGPIQDGELDVSKVSEIFKKIYKGPLKSEDVTKKLKEYDVLLLPTYYEGEGYPGIIIEAYSLNKPVITTIWNSIPEIVEDKVTGLLISIKDEKELSEAIRFFNEDNYKMISNNIPQHFKQFDRDKVYKAFLGRI